MRAWRSAGIALLLAGALTSRPTAQIPPLGGRAAFVADLAARRRAVMSELGVDTVLVLWSAPPRVFSADIDYEYRQESNLLYLTGIVQEDTILVLIPAGRSIREVLFVREATPYSELWTGHSLTRAEAAEQSGIDTVVVERSTEAFEPLMRSLLGTRTSSADAAPPATTGVETLPKIDAAAFDDARRVGKARLALLGRVPDRPSPSPAVDAALDADSAPHVRWASDIQRTTTGVSLFSADAVLSQQREVKTAYEQTVLKRSVEISAQAHVEGMKTARPGRWEYEVEAAIEYSYFRHGAMSFGYPSIVASGPNATTLHYLKSTRQMRDGELLLVDAAGNYQGLTGDITRTYPVNGRFSRDQRALYELVLRAQNAGISAAVPGGRADDITKAVRNVFADGLVTLGLVADDAEFPIAAQVSLWFPHGPVHGIGVDVHDPLNALVPGAAFVIEPGLYIRSDTFETLRRAHPALAARIRPAVERYLDVGVRIEDSFLMTSSGPLMLSSDAPRAVSDIERVVGTGP